MELKLNIFLVLAGTLIVAANRIQTASAQNGKLLKFYPISKEQYRSILKLSNLQPAISEARVMQHHRSLADWSSSLHNSWSNLFNYTKPGGGGEVIKGYPICVLKTDDSKIRRKRSARQYDDDNNVDDNNDESEDYSGIAPTVIYTGPSDYSSYGRPPYDNRPPYHGPPYHGPPYHVPPYHRPPYHRPPGSEPGDDDEEDEENIPSEPEKGPVVNCVVVVRGKSRPEGGYTRPPHGYPPHYPHRPPHIPPHHYYPYPYPYPPPHYGHEHTARSALQSEYSVMDPAADAYYQQKLHEYNQHMQSLYMADDTFQVPETQDDANNVEYNDDEEDDNDMSTMGTSER